MTMLKSNQETVSQAALVDFVKVVLQAEHFRPQQLSRWKKVGLPHFVDDPSFPVSAKAWLYRNVEVDHGEAFLRKAKTGNGSMNDRIVKQLHLYYTPTDPNWTGEKQ